MGAFTISTVVHTERNDSNNSRTWTLAGHTEAKPQLVIQKRRDTGPSTDRKLETEFKTVFGTEDAAGDPLDTMISFVTIGRYPYNAKLTDIQAAWDEHQLLTASSESDTVVEKRNYFG